MSESSKKQRFLVVGEAYTAQLAKLDALPEPGCSSRAGKASVTVGGRGLNAALMLRFLGAQSCLCAKIGEDVGGRMISSFCVRNDIDHRWLYHDANLRTGSELVMMPNGAPYTRVEIPSAAGRLRADELDDALYNLCPDAVLLSGSLDPDIQKEVCFITRRQGGAIALDASRCAPEQLPLHALESLDLLQIDEACLCALLELPELNVRNVLSALIRLEEMVHLKGCIIRRADGSAFLFWDKERRVASPVENHPILDTAAASDCFCAAFFYSILQNCPLNAVCDLAEYVHALALSGDGAALSVPSMEKMRKMAPKMRS